MRRLRFEELRPLRLPFWITLILAGVLPVFRTFDNPAYFDNPALIGEAWSFFVGFLQFAFFAGVLLLAALPFGIEFQYRTFTLWLSQPRSRSELWRERVGFALLCIIVCGSVHLLAGVVMVSEYVRGVIAGLGNGMPWIGEIHVNSATVDTWGKDSLMIQGFLLASACSACFWTLSAGTVIGGMVFTFAGEVLGT